MKDHEHTHGSCGGIDRRDFMRGCGAAAAIAAAGLSAETVAANTAAIADLLDDLPNNWGRWGEEDELGAVNFLDSRQLWHGMQAATRRGSKRVERFTLQLPMTGDTIDVLAEGAEPPTDETGDPLFPGRTPGRRDNTQDASDYDDGSIDPLAGGMKFSDDRFVTELYLHGATHVDALGHAWYGDRLYNDYNDSVTAAEKEFDRPVKGYRSGEEAEDIRATSGHETADVAPLADNGIAGRAVLLDVGRHMGDPQNGWLDLGEGITLDDLLATAEAQRTQIRERDILLIRTGSTERVTDPEAEWNPTNEPGLAFSEDLVEWVHEMEIPMIGADNVAVEKVAQEIDGQVYTIPLHGALLRNLGVSLNEVLRLDELAAQCDEDGIYEFLFVGAPLHVERATGAPMNPIALKATD